MKQHNCLQTQHFATSSKSA